MAVLSFAVDLGIHEAFYSLTPANFMEMRNYWGLAICLFLGAGFLDFVRIMITTIDIFIHISLHVNI